MDAKQYGDAYHTHLLEQYKLYVEMADRISQRRDAANRFYAGLLSGIAAVLALAIGDTLFAGLEAAVYFMAASIGAILCVIWFLNVRSYRALNSGKFQVIHDIETYLPMALYAKEWDILRPQEGQKRYLQLTRIEQIVPWTLFIPYSILAGYSLYRWLVG